MLPIFHAEDNARWREQVRSSVAKHNLQVVQATGLGDAIATIDSLCTPPEISLAIVDGN